MRPKTAPALRAPAVENESFLQQQRARDQNRRLSAHGDRRVSFRNKQKKQLRKVPAWAGGQQGVSVPVSVL
jgi:hypothetical protein